MTIALGAIASGAISDTPTQAAGGTTLTAETGSFVATGANAKLAIGLKTSTGASTATGQTTPLILQLIAGTGAFVVTTYDATFVIPAADQSDGRSNAGGGGKRKRRQTARLDDDFWETRERYLKYLRAKYEKPVAEEREAQPQLQETTSLDVKIRTLEQQRITAFADAERARSREQLRTASARIAELSEQIQQLSVQYWDEALIALLLDL